MIRNVLARASGIQRTASFDLWHDRGVAPSGDDVLSGSFRPMGRDGDGRPQRPPVATAFTRLARFLQGAQTSRAWTTRRIRPFRIRRRLRASRAALELAAQAGPAWEPMPPATITLPLAKTPLEVASSPMLLDA